MGLLKQVGIANKDTNTTKLFESLLSDDFKKIKYASPKEYVDIYWKALKNKNQATLEGGVFEFIIYTLLYREGLCPFYTQAKVAFVPNVLFDTMLYSKQSPVSLSLKTSLRERYKQADLEAVALKYVHRKAKCYLLTMSSSEAENVKNKIKSGEVIGLDKVVDCSTEDINDLINELKEMQNDFIPSYQIDVITGNLVK